MMRLKQNIVITETGFVFDSDTGDSYSTNPVGLELLEKLKANVDMDEITAQITGRYDVEPLQFQRYFDDFVIMLRHFNLLEDTE
ncbi:MAG: PqqD family protein [Bacteroidales bacterium]|nr:PqqD family protein [Bacteroidales bacterium]